MKPEHFAQHPLMPYAEARHSISSERVFKPHLHRRLSIGAVSQGKVHFTVGDQRETLLPGSLALINPDTLHSCNCDQGENRNYYMLYLEVNYCLALQQTLFDVTTFQPFEKIILHNKDMYDKYINCMDGLLQSEEATLKKEQSLAELVTELFSLTCFFSATTRQQPGGNDEHLKSLRGWLSENLGEDTSLHQFAELHDINGYTLLRQFKEVYGVTPHQYRMNCRIEQARKLLQSGKDITETALECGFFDQSHFHKYFKATTTVTPKEYQLNFLQ